MSLVVRRVIRFRSIATTAWQSTANAATSASAPAPEMSPQAGLAEAFGYRNKPKPLSLPPDSKLRYVEPQPGGLKGILLKLMGFYTNESRRMRDAKVLYARITAHVENPELYSSFGLEKKFRTTHAMLLLHVWMVLVRLRAEAKEGAKIGQVMYEMFNADLEQRIYHEGVKMTLIISKWLKQLEKNFYGASKAYDNAMLPDANKDDLARALWRNIYAEDDPTMPLSGHAAANVQALARYVRRELACLAMTESEDFVHGNISFSKDFSV